MRDVLIVLLIAAAGYLVYDNYYKQRPALQQAQAEIQQLRQTSASVAAGSSHSYVPVNPPNPPTWFQKHLEESSSTLDAARRHKQKDEDARPQP
jgi:hypothetical protein